MTDRLVRARVLLAEAESLGLTLEDLSAAAVDRPRASRSVPTVAEYVRVVDEAFENRRTAETYRSHWKLAVERFGDCRIDALDFHDCEQVVADAVAGARLNRPGTDGRSSRETCVTALRALFTRAQPATSSATPPRPSRSRAVPEAAVAPSTTPSSPSWWTPCGRPAATRSWTCSSSASTWRAVLAGMAPLT